MSRQCQDHLGPPKPKIIVPNTQTRNPDPQPLNPKLQVKTMLDRPVRTSPLGDSESQHASPERAPAAQRNSADGMHEPSTTSNLEATRTDVLVAGGTAESMKERSKSAPAVPVEPERAVKDVAASDEVRYPRL